MASNYGDTVNAFYLAYYGRPADPAGLAFWTAALEKNNGDFSTIVSAFANSQEATSRFASESVSDRVSDIYQQLFGRAPDKAGLDFWVEAIQSGRLSMANAAIEIVHGAQTSDAQTSTLRQQVAAQFTAEVKASGVAYDGAAAVQAARVLISAVNADSKPADIDSLVKAGASLVQTAHDNPAIITALANGGDLSAVLNTASGKADPVAVVQALASIGKAALTDSAGLNTLLQGGGMAGLLDSLPAGTSVKDVAAAVNQGGLSAGVEAAKPAPAIPADTAPPAAPSVQLVQDTGISATDHVTSNGKIQVSGIETGAAWQYSFDAGKTWATGAAANADGVASLDTTVNGEQTLQVRAIDAAGNISAAASFQYTLRTSLNPTMIFTVDGKEVPGLDTLSVNSPDYLVHIFNSNGKGTTFDFQVSDSGKDGSWTTIKDTDPLSEGTHYIRYVAADLAGNVGATNALKLVMDLTAPGAPKVELANDTGVSATDHITSDGHVKVSGIEANGSWEYSFDGKTWTAGPAANADGVAILATTANGAQTLQVRSHDLARNTSDIVKLDYSLQTTFTPTLAFRDGANGADLPGATLLTNTDDYWVTLHGGLNAAKVVFQLSDSGVDGTWADADPSAPLSDGTHYIRDIVTDRAGNVGTTNALRVDMDKTAPVAPTVALVSDTGVSDTDHFTSDGHIKVSGIEAKGSWEYSVDAGKAWTAGPAANAEGVAILATTAGGPQSLQVRSIDAAHNTSAVTSFDYVLQTSYSPWLAFRDGANGADLPGATLLTNTDNFWITLHGGIDAAKVVFQTSDSGMDGTWKDADMAAPLSDGTHYIRDIVTDFAGNVGTTNALRVDMDKTAPAAPTVALVNDTGISATDGLTTWPEYRVSGIEAGASWEYSLDAGTTWLKGAALDANGAAIGVLPTSGDQTLLFRATDKAGNVSSAATLHANYDTIVPVESLAFDHITGSAKGVSETTLTKVDAVYAFTGLKAGAVVEYSFGGDIWTKVDASMIDTAAKTITIKDIDLSAGDKYLQLSVKDAAGWSSGMEWTFIDGPVTKFTTQVTDTGIVIVSDQGANAYLTSNGTPVQILSTETDGRIISDIGTAVGVQAAGVSGVLGVGRSAAIHSDGDVAYGFGSTGNDTLSGKFAWGYAGNDDITTVGSGGTIVGGAGADTIHVNSGSSKLVIHGVAESQILADTSAAHGFDTVYTSPAGQGITLSFAFDAEIKDSYLPAAASSYTGAETGVELLALLTGAVAGSFQAKGDGQAMVVQTGGADNFLVVDVNGDAKIDAADYVVKIVGSIDPAHMAIGFGTGSVYLPVTV
jgi:hypothetical protein